MQVFFSVPSSVKDVPMMDTPAFTGPQLGCKFECIDKSNNTIRLVVTDVVYSYDTTGYGGSYLQCRVVLSYHD